MRSGSLRHRIAFQKKEISQDGFGGIAAEWKDAFPAWAAISGISGREGFESSRETSEGDMRVTVRFIEGLDTLSWRIRRGREIYGITAMKFDNRKTSLTLICRKASYEQEAAEEQGVS